MNKNYDNRKFVVGGLFGTILIIFLIRLFSIQVIDDSYKTSSENNVLRKEVDYPSRGLVYDRNDKLIVYNEAAYDLMITPNQLKEIDTNLLCTILNVDTINLIKRFNKAKNYSSYKASVFMKQISVETYAKLQEHLYLFPGFYARPRTLRKYPINAASHILGYVGEVSRKTVKKYPYYGEGDYIGISGIEKAYEEHLRQ